MSCFQAGVEANIEYLPNIDVMLENVSTLARSLIGHLISCWERRSLIGESDGSRTSGASGPEVVVITANETTLW